MATTYTAAVDNGKLVTDYQAKKKAEEADKNSGSSLGYDQFLTLLCAEMQYQDPLDPMDNGEYLSQLAQFSALEQMTEVADKMENVHSLVENLDTSVLVGQLTNMIGKTVQWATTDSDGNVTVHEGTAKSVSISDGAPSLMVETEIKDASGNTTKAITKVDISTITRVGDGDISE